LRRYQDFAWLEEILGYEYFGRVIPMNPPKSMLTKIGISNEKFMRERREGVERFARRVLRMDGINSCDHIFNFFFTNRKDLQLYQEQTKGLVVHPTWDKVSAVKSYLESFLKYRILDLSRSNKQMLTTEVSETVKENVTKLRRLKQTFDLFTQNMNQIMTSHKGRMNAWAEVVKE
jgi:hypothetical protein